MSSYLSVAVLGASGYTGIELLRFLLQHPCVKVVALSGESQAGKSMEEVFPHLAGVPLPKLQKIEEIDFSVVELVFCCLPHATTQPVIASLPSHLKIIDLSADFRLRDPAIYQQWYGHAHQAISHQQSAVYGLTEIYRETIRQSRLIANPGCYPTAAQLPLIPLLRQRLIQTNDIIIDAKSGITGAGRKASQNLLYTELNEGLSVYGVGIHRHTPEIEQGLSEAGGAEVLVRFTPHLTPMSRGILATTYVSLASGVTVENLRSCLQQVYANQAFIRLLSPETYPSTAMVRGSNLCVIGIYADRIAGKAIVVSAIDNLVKGASGQAVQNMNLLYGWDETLGLPQLAVFP